MSWRSFKLAAYLTRVESFSYLDSQSEGAQAGIKGYHETMKL